MRLIQDIFRSYAEFDLQGRHVNGTDKESNHRYGDAYEQLFAHSFHINKDNPLCGRKNVKLMLEVGVADGSSLLAWREVFPNALCVGMDIHPSARANGDRIEFHLGDQCSLADCRRVVGGRKFDFICEDATHRMEYSLQTLLYLWRHVKPGGLYVIEEFDNVGDLRGEILSLLPNASIIDTIGPWGGNEPLVALRKSHLPEE